MVNIKSAVKGLRIVVSTALIMAFLSQSISPLVVKADMANISQKPFDSEIIAKGKTLPKVKLAAIDWSMKVDQPDKVMDAVITAYTSTPGQTDDTPFIAATGKRVHDGMIAANGLPFGTRIKIPSLYGDKIFVVEDRMNRRYGLGRMDIWLDTTRAEAMKFGVKRVEVEIFYPEKKIVKK